MSQPQKRVCLFGTSANPPTSLKGHAGIVSFLISLNLYDEIRVIPVYRHMYRSKRTNMAKDSSTYEEEETFDNKLHMCKLAFCNIEPSSESKTIVTVSDIERVIYKQKLSELTSYSSSTSSEEAPSIRVSTANVLEYLTLTSSTSSSSSSLPATTTIYSFCLGSDTYIDLCSGIWTNAKFIKAALDDRFVVIHRIGVDCVDKIGCSLDEFVDLQRKGSKDDDDDDDVLYFPATLYSAAGLADVSSTRARNTSNYEELLNVVGADVAGYVLDKGLYGWTRNEEGRGVKEHL